MTAPKRRLWDKAGERCGPGFQPEHAPLDEVIHRFTVGDDPDWDRHLVHWDCLGSAAHARTLERAGWLTADECRALLRGLAQIDARHHAGEFEIPPTLEDCHTAIEAFLTEHCGDVGGKIHIGRSRNDQVATAMRLYMRAEALRWAELLRAFIEAVRERIERDGDVAMPGYTHLQPAMPSSIGQWLHAFAEAALEQMRAVLHLLERLDSCPLGTGAGFGVPLELDRARTAALLGFSRVQRSPIDVQNSRGRMELLFVRVAVDIGAFVEKLAWDCCLYATAEFGFIRLPEEMTTGSSIMPQKRNPDVLELLRARASRLRARQAELESVCTKLPSSYHRDLQLTKQPAIRVALELPDILHVATRVVRGLTIDRARLADAMRPELYATHAAVQRAREGVPFRDAYRQIGRDIQAGRFKPPTERAAGSSPRGMTAPTEVGGSVMPAAFDTATLHAFREDLTAVTQAVDSFRDRIRSAEANLLPDD